MILTAHYASPLGPILMAADQMGLIGLWFEGQNHFASTITPDAKDGDSPVFQMVKNELDLYFQGKNPKFQIPLHLKGTAFQREVWKLLLEIPYGTTVTYGDIAHRISLKQNDRKISPQAVGNAVGRNPITIIIPCHRVLGAHGKLSGYAGGLTRKESLLKLEQIVVNLF